jgi:hypothetical protein
MYAGEYCRLRELAHVSGFFVFRLSMYLLMSICGQIQIRMCNIFVRVGVFGGYDAGHNSAHYQVDARG